MKKIFFTLFCISPLFICAQKINSFYIESSIFRNNYHLKSNALFSSLHYTPPPSLRKHSFSENNDSAWRTYTNTNGKIKIEGSQFPGFVQSDYQQIAIGISSKLKQYRKGKITNSFGIVYGLNNTKMGNLWQDRYSDRDSISNLSVDTVYSITAYHTNKRMGLSYNLEFSCKLKKFELIIGSRFATHLAFNDKTILFYNKKIEHINHNFTLVEENSDGFMGILPRGYSLFNNDKPELDKDNSVLQRKPTLFFDWVLYLKATFNINSYFGMYTSWGLTPYTRYYRKAQFTNTNLVNSMVSIGFNITINP